MGYLQNVFVFGFVAILLQPNEGMFFKGYSKKTCPVKPPGISSFRPVTGTRLYYAWSTVQGSARKAFTNKNQCRGAKILDCSCMGFDVVGYNRTNVETQEGFTFGVNKKLGVADMFHFERPWVSSEENYLKCHYTTDYQYGALPKHSSKYGSRYPSTSYSSVYTKNNPTAIKMEETSSAFKVLSWTATEVVFYDCASPDPDIRVYTTYTPKAKSVIPYSVFDILSQVGIDINSLRWIKLDHQDCVYPDATKYSKLLSKKSKY
ncbi:hypothetical protein WDU94_014475 [Cyamophila willieti]